MKCYICDTEFEDTLETCPRCGTPYKVDLKSAIRSTSGLYTGLRTSGFDPVPSVRAEDDKAMADRLLNNGLQLAREERFEEACGKFQEANRWDPANAEILFYWGSAAFKLEHFLEAEVHWKNALRLAPGEEKYARWLEKVREILEGEF